ncbi:hypothetical protein ACRAWD_14145 [Caulobacter segnis]
MDLRPLRATLIVPHLFLNSERRSPFPCPSSNPARPILGARAKDFPRRPAHRPDHRRRGRSGTPWDYAALAAEGFAKNPVAYRCVRLIAEAAAATPLSVFVDGRRAGMTIR